MQHTRRTERIAWGITGVFAAVIAYTTLSPIDQLPGVPTNDKLMHLLGFGALAMPLAFAYPRRALAVVIAATLFGGAIEVIQPFTGRSAEWFDLVADAGGAALGAIAGVWAAKIWQKVSAG